MGPPTKKRRHGPSPPKDAQDEDDDDELASHPQEIKIRRDPDIQLALKRANANQKLHATMAHIIEKYSRDFEGIGDEIDMATGEIVVNNGHLRNMRDEGDVEGLWVEGESDIDEDEGILLGDLTDEYSDTEGQANKIPGSQPENEISQVSRTKENDTEAHPQDQNGGVEGASDNVSSTASSQNEVPQDRSRALHSELPYDDPRLGSSSFGPMHSPDFGMPPSAFGPWGMMPGFPIQAWGRDDIPPYFNIPPSMSGPWFTGGRYETASNSGQASIWGRNWTRKTKRIGSMKGSFKRTSNKYPSDAVEGVAEAPDGDRGSGTKLTGENSNKQEAPLSDPTINTSDEEEDFLCSGTSDPKPIVQSSPVPSSDKALSKDHSLHDPPHKVLKETNGNAVKLSRQSDEKDNSDRRRSNRARKQTSYMGKISWDDARELKKSGKTFTVRVRRADPSLREEFQSVDLSDKETEGEGSLPPEQTEIDSTSTDEVGTRVACQNLAIPDSQGTAAPFDGSAPRRSQSKNAKEPSPFTHNMIPATELSDDEAPLALSRIRAPRWPNGVPMVVSPVPDVPTRHDEHSAEPIDATSAPSRNNDSPSPEAGVIVYMANHTTQSLKRKRGRPKGSTSSAKTTPSKSSIPVRAKEVKSASPTAIIASATGDLPQSMKRKRGRPRKSDVLAPTIQDETNNPVKELVHAGDEVTENGQHRSSDETLDNEVSKISPHLSHELRWLLKTKPKDSAPDRTCDTFLYKFVRPRKAKETLQQTKNDETEVQDVAQEGEEVPKDITDNIQEQTILQKSQELIQEVDTIMGDVPQTRQNSESIQDYQSLPASPSSLPHDGGTPNDNMPPEGDELVGNDSPTLHVVTDDEAIESEESLPLLPRDFPIQEASTPQKPKDTRSSLIEPPSSSQKPHTPRHRYIHTNRAPSSRRSLLSFVSDSDSDTEGSRDELARRVKSHPKSASVNPSSTKMRRPATLTREIHRTPSKRRVHEISSPIGVVKTPGGTIRTCGVGGYHCGRDYCFTCI
ncbi:hypothetical protein FPOAC1_000707 [Fusarium poae]|uniref:Uncharacterized protein n=1 Tax=Fusarium poae TaxID=36050 RepID=A0A1B8B1Z8_FUSPO|nr:hypothetical protein FPOAC1_000707 [Fusarium poae]KAG8674735.1 hypothetical protein FPOAC1_000707 [Fusarium poae]OBS26742.1 hypothetical protein FPOA_00684 [Fusarium poae]